MSVEHWLRRRESGFSIGNENTIMRSVYSTMNMFNSYHANCAPGTGQDTGAIFNLEFNADGNIVVAACEKNSILVFDAITQSNVIKVPEAHSNSVNCIKFFDEHLFASGSDDYTVALWDLRNMKQRQRVLHGHSNWVKNIEYSSKDKLLVSSGFDGSIFSWDINSQTEQGLISQRVFHASGLMRCRISPSGDKLVLCTSGGYIMIVHNLDLTTLHKDLCGFRPGIYRLMQLGEQYIPQAAKYDHVFSKRQKKNRVELVADFPEQNDAEMIMALQIHPQCRCMLTRNVSCDEKSEWTCIHDINEEPTKDEDEYNNGEPLPKKKRQQTTSSNSPNDQGESVESETQENGPLAGRPGQFRYSGIYRRPTASSRPGDFVSSSSTARPVSFIPDIWAAEVTVQERAIRQSRRRSSNHHGYNFVYAISSGVLPMRVDGTSTDTINLTRAREPRTSPAGETVETSTNTTPSRPNHLLNLEITRRIRPLTSSNAASASSKKDAHSILVNAKKLLYYITEINHKPGFIKEPGFSSDGRIICSPYGNGVRLLGYQGDCSEYPSNQQFEEVKRSPRQLVEISKINEHQDVVLCAKFSPREPLLVSGCNAGEVTWYRPNL